MLRVPNHDDNLGFPDTVTNVLPPANEGFYVLI